MAGVRDQVEELILIKVGCAVYMPFLSRYEQ